MSDLRKIIIDDTEVEVDGAMTLIQACEQAGIEVPRFLLPRTADDCWQLPNVLGRSCGWSPETGCKLCDAGARFAPRSRKASLRL